MCKYLAKARPRSTGTWQKSTNSTISFFYIMFLKFILSCPVDWGCRGVRRRPLNEGPGYDTKQSDGEAAVFLELWGMGSTPSLLSLSGPLLAGVVATDKVLSMVQIEQNCILMLNRIA